MRNSDFMFEVGQLIKTNSGSIIITKHEKFNGYKNYQYKCQKCGYNCGEFYTNDGKKHNELWITEDSLKNGSGCACCGTYATVENINSIKATIPNYKDYGVSEEDAKRYRPNNKNVEIKCICSNCGKIHKKTIKNVFRNNYVVCNCGNGRSYPEKFISKLLDINNIEYIIEFSKSNEKWCGKYRYDFYLPDYNSIIEVHGKQHYKQTNRKGARTLEEEQINDETKKELALNNGINKYIIVDFRNSNVDWIKNSIKTTELFNIVTITDDILNECDKYALSNSIKYICDLWNKYKINSPYGSITDFISCNNLKITRQCVRKYLKKGNEFGWCIYNPDSEKKNKDNKNARNNRCKYGKRVAIVKNGIILKIYNSLGELEENSINDFGVFLSKTQINLICNKKRKTLYKDFDFLYINN